jgi:limonene 1,2-monooxygenase
MTSLKFGAFIPGFHALGEDPAGALWRDLDLIEWLDEIGIDEAWVGEHHAGGWVLINSPEVFLGAAAARTRRIRLGTGVVSLPYHHPLMAANRLCQLDHMTRGRIMMGVGAGVSPADASMLGIPAANQRRMMGESLEAIVALLHGDEPVTMRTDWFELRDATVHLRPYQRPCFDLAVASAGSERGMRLAGRHGLCSLNFWGRPGMNEPPLSGLWCAAEAEAEECGQQVDRSKWRVAVCAHIAETRELAFDQVREGMTRWFREYVQGTMGASANLPQGREVEAAVEAGSMIVGSVDDAIEAIECMLDESGGFGTLLVNVQDWATRQQIKDSFELLSRYVAPHFAGRLEGVEASNLWVRTNRDNFAAEARRAAAAASKVAAGA